MDNGTHENGGRWKRMHKTIQWYWWSEYQQPLSEYTGIVWWHPDTSGFMLDVADLLAQRGDREIEWIDGFTGSLDERREHIARINAITHMSPTEYVAFHQKLFDCKQFDELVAYNLKRRYGDEDLIYGVCINPSCRAGSVFPPDDNYGVKYIYCCPSCNCVTSIRAEHIDDHEVRAAATLAMATKISINRLAHAAKARMLLQIKDNVPNTIVRYEGGLVFKIKMSDNPSFANRGKHFIRGRVNTEVMKKLGCRITPSGEFLQLGISTDNLALQLILRLNEDPMQILDEKMADSYRADYIDSMFNDEIASFAKQLSSMGVLRVDSAGVNETLRVIYALAQKKAGARSIIKKSGDVQFPTDKVIQSIDSDLITKAFTMTEHSMYQNVEQAFNIA